MKYQHRHQIQNHITHRGQQQHIEGSPAITQGPQHCRGNVVDELEEQPQGVNAEVGHRIPKQVILHPQHPVQQPSCPNKGQDGKGHAHSHQHQHGGGHTPAHLRHGSGPVELGNHNGGTSGHAHGNRDKQQGQRGTGAHSRQGCLSHKIAHNDAIYRIVELLQQVARHQRQSKEKN